MDWSQSYTATWRVFRVNRNTWADAEQITNVDSVSLSRTADGNLLESGSLSVTGDFDSDYYRIVMTAEQNNELTRVDVATLLFDASGGEVNYGVTTNDVNGYSVLYPASTKAVTTGEYAPAGCDGALYAKNLLQSAINAPVVVEGSFTLNDHIVHELGSEVIGAVWSVLDAGDFVIQVDGGGVVHIRPRPTQPSLIIDSTAMSLLSNGISFSADQSEIPNRYVVIDGNNITVAENSDPQSVVSTATRGYTVDVIDTSPTPVNSETYSEYANRMLHKASFLKDQRNYEREYAPDVYPYSIIRATIDGLTGDYRVESQSIECSNGITVNEKASREVNLW